MDPNFILLLCLPYSLIAQFTTTLPIEEHGVSYNQTMTLDVLTGDVLMHVPKHTRDGVNYYEIDRIENEDMGIIISKLQEESYCMLKKMPESMRPIQTVVLGAELTANHSAVTLDDMELYYHWEQCEEEVNPDEREELHEDMKDLCKEIPIIRVNTTRITKETFEALVKGDEYEGFGDEPGDSNRQGMTRRASCGTCHAAAMQRSLDLTLEHNLYVHVPCRLV